MITFKVNPMSTDYLGLGGVGNLWPLSVRSAKCFRFTLSFGAKMQLAIPA